MFMEEPVAWFRCRSKACRRSETGAQKHGRVAVLKWGTTVHGVAGCLVELLGILIVLLSLLRQDQSPGRCRIAAASRCVTPILAALPSRHRSIRFRVFRSLGLNRRFLVQRIDRVDCLSAEVVPWPIDDVMVHGEHQGRFCKSSPTKRVDPGV